jgi:hypothetical protein
VSRWFRLYADAMRNPKVLRLTDRQFRLWVQLLSVASENDGHIPCAADLRLTLGVRLDHLQGGLNDLIKGGLIDASGDGYEPHNWSKFQYKSDTSRERVAKHRAARNVTVTPPDTDTETERKNDDDVSAGAGGRANNLDVPMPDVLAVAAEAARAAGVRHANPGDIIRNCQLIREWQEAGADPPAILAAIRDDRARPDAPNITSLKYFDAAIRKSAARKDAASHGYQPKNRQPGRSAAPPSGRLGAVLELLAESRAAAAAVADQPGDYGIAGRIGHAVSQG